MCCAKPAEPITLSATSWLRGLDHAEKEQLAGRQQHPMRQRVVVGRRHRLAVAAAGDVTAETYCYYHYRLAVAVPRDGGGGVAGGLAVERRRFVAGHVHVIRVLDDARLARS